MAVVPRILHTLGFGELVWIGPPGRKIAALFGGQDVEEVWERWVWSWRPLLNQCGVGRDV